MKISTKYHFLSLYFMIDCLCFFKRTVKWRSIYRLSIYWILFIFNNHHATYVATDDQNSHFIIFIHFFYARIVNIYSLFECTIHRKHDMQLKRVLSDDEGCINVPLDRFFSCFERVFFFFLRIHNISSSTSHSSFEILTFCRNITNDDK